MVTDRVVAEPNQCYAIHPHFHDQQHVDVEEVPKPSYHSGDLVQLVD